MSLWMGWAGCGAEETGRPFGGGLSGTAGSGGNHEGLVRGNGGVSGILDVTSGPGEAVGGSAVPRGSDGAAGGSSPGPGQSGTGGSAGVGIGAAGSFGASGGAGGRLATATGGAVVIPISGGTGSSHSGGVSGGSGGAGTGGRVVVSGTGGSAASSGGARGTGGATVASGGALGSGGVIASTGGGSGGAPSGATGGTSGSAAECQQYIAAYDAELQNARMCKVAGNGNGPQPCSVSVPAKLAGCGSSCTTFVDKAAMLDQIQKKWIKAGCTAPACNISACLNPTSATCSSGGMCSDSLL